jgi:hypothetical protein
MAHAKAQCVASFPLQRTVSVLGSDRTLLVLLSRHLQQWIQQNHWATLVRIVSVPAEIRTKYLHTAVPTRST